MKKLLCGLLTGYCCAVNSGTMGPVEESYPYFFEIGAGYSWSGKAGIQTNSNAWDPATQGYNSDLGESSFYFFEVGKTVHPFVDISLSYINHDEFSYQKYQSAPQPTPLPQGFTGNSRTRHFQLDNKAVLINAILHPVYNMASFYGVHFNPFVSGGIGMGYNRVKDFHTVGLVNPPGVGSVTSIGDDSSKTSFAWQGSLGVNLKPDNSNFSMDLGYRYFSGGKFEAPGTIVSNTATNPGQIITTNGWTGKLKTNEMFVGFKYSA